jgi:sulfate transport system ATP-binding protein
VALIVEHVSKRFERFPALSNVSLRAEPREFIALLGPSGSGKTTLLRVLAGLERPDNHGRVEFDGEDFLALTPRARRVGMVFQHYALFRHMTVAQNIAYGLQVRPKAQRPSKDEIRARVASLLELVQLQGLEKRFPAQLSGGQRQRVALARALAIEPRMLLLDEPFGALDAKVRKELRHELRRIHRETGVTTVFVTHDQEEAMDLADRVAILSKGVMQQIGTPEEIAAAPASAFVFQFLGDANRLACRMTGRNAVFDGFSAPAVVASGGEAAETAWFRPHETELSPEGTAGLPVAVVDVLDKGAVLRAECRAIDGRLFEADFARNALPDCVRLGAHARLKPRQVFVFPEPAEG